MVSAGLRIPAEPYLRSILSLESDNFGRFLNIFSQKF